jgi:hypothetical protein
MATKGELLDILMKSCKKPEDIVVGNQVGSLSSISRFSKIRYNVLPAQSRIIAI